MSAPADIADLEARDKYFRDNFNTALTPEEEQQYQFSTHAHDTTDYDMRGAWKAQAGQADNGHYPDTYKKPNHPTFSDESQYHGATDEQNGGKWEGGHWGENSYAPSRKMLHTTQSADSLKEYMKRIEPDAELLLPEEQEQ